MARQLVRDDLSSPATASSQARGDGLSPLCKLSHPFFEWDGGR